MTKPLSHAIIITEREVMRMAKRTAEQTEALIQKHMKTLHCTREEAIDVIRCDDEIDRGNTELFPLTAEQKKMVRGLTKADRDPNAKREVKRERKIDDDKLTVFTILKEALEGAEIENLTCKNEAEISFAYNGAEYTVKLTKHRAKKA